MDTNVKYEVIIHHLDRMGAFTINAKSISQILCVDFVKYQVMLEMWLLA